MRPTETALRPGHLVTVDFAAHFPGLPNLTFDEYRSMTESAYKALEGLRHHLHELIAEGDRVVYRSTNIGKHVGEIAGVAGTGKEVHITSLAEFRSHPHQSFPSVPISTHI